MLTPFTIAGLVPLWLYTLGRYVSGISKINIPFANIAYSLLGLLAAVGVGLLLKVKKPRWARAAITASKVEMIDRAIMLFICLFTQSRWRGLAMPSRHSVEIHQGDEATRNTSENARPRSSQLAESLWTDHLPGEWHWCSRADLYLKKNNNKNKQNKTKTKTKHTHTHRQGMIRRTFLQNPRMRGKAQHI